jgi:NitT/TauT family transport system ATP-binding protein
MCAGGVRLPGISIRCLNFGYGDNRIFEGFNLELGRENPAVILGPSGCGKTTLLFLIARLLKPSGGEILIGDFSAGNGDGVGRIPVSPEDRPARHPAAVLVFQEPRLLPWMTALENAALPLQGFLGKKPARERARCFLELAGLGDKIHSFPGELSGGQRQRVSLARAFAFPSPVILLDEPFQSLDIPLKAAMMDLVMTLLDREQGRLVVAVTHDPREAVYLGRRILVLGKAAVGKAGGLSDGFANSFAEGTADPPAQPAPPAAIIFDETPNLNPEDRFYGSPAQAPLERRLLEALEIAL